MRTDVGVEFFSSPEYADQFRNHPSLKVFPFTAKVGSQWNTRPWEEIGFLNSVRCIMVIFRALSYAGHSRLKIAF